MATKEQVKGFWFSTGTNQATERVFEIPPHWVAINVERCKDNSIIIWARRNGG